MAFSATNYLFIFILIVTTSNLEEKVLSVKRKRKRGSITWSIKKQTKMISVPKAKSIRKKQTDLHTNNIV
jgi:hypothetical protein